MRFLLIFAVVLLPCRAQVLGLSAGKSTIQNATGAGATLFLNGSTTTLGVGDVDGRMRFSASSAFQFHSADVVLGDYLFLFSAGASAISTPMRGVYAHRQTSAGRKVSAFVGAAGQSYSSQFFNAYSAQHIAAGIVLEQELPRNFSSATAAMLVGGRRTFFETVAYHNPSARLQANISAGRLLRGFTTTGQVSYRPIAALMLAGSQADYIFAGKSVPVSNGTTGTSLHAFSAQAGVFHSPTYNGEIAGAGYRFWRLTLATNYTRSRNSHSLSSSVEERINSHLTLRQFLTGRRVTFGGRWQSNLFSVDAGYDTYFFPLTTGHGSPFQQVLSVSLHVQLPHSLTINAQTLTSNSKTSYTIGGQTFAAVPNVGILTTANSLGTPVGIGAKMNGDARGGKFLVRGIVLDEDGKTLEGAAVKVGDVEVFSNTRGEFQARFSKAKEQKIQIVLGDFIAGGEWQVANTPVSVVPAVDPTPFHVRVSRGKL